MLGDGHGAAGDVNFLEGIFPDHVTGHITGDGHQGDAVHVGIGNPGDQVGRTRAAGGQNHPGFSRGTGVPVRRIASALFIHGENVPNSVAVIVKSIVNIQHRTSRIAENGIDPLLYEDMD